MDNSYKQPTFCFAAAKKQYHIKLVVGPGQAASILAFVCVMQNMTHDDVSVATWKKDDNDHPDKVNIAYFQCPRCPHVESSSCVAFQYHDLDVKQLCNACCRKSVVKMWKCECGVIWHSCATHRHRTCRDNNPSMKKPAHGRTSSNASINDKQPAKRTRVLPPPTYEQILAEDVEKAKRKQDALDAGSEEQCITLGFTKHRVIKSNFLGPILKKRFLG